MTATPLIRQRPALQRLVDARKRAAAERRQAIAADLRRNPFGPRYAWVSTQAKRFGVSAKTIQRDLEILAALAEAS